MSSRLGSFDTSIKVTRFNSKLMEARSKTILVDTKKEFAEDSRGLLMT